MPKQVDHAARREELALAALRLCARDGLAALTVGLVAREAGVSKGLVQHYFPAKSDLVRATTRTLRLRIERHLAAATAGADGPRDTLRRVLLGLVDLGAAEPVLQLASHAFLAQVATDPDARTQYRSGVIALHREVAGLVRAAGPRPGVDPAAEAHVLLGMAASLADAVLVGALDRAAAADLLDYHLTRTLGGPGDRAAGSDP